MALTLLAALPLCLAGAAPVFPEDTIIVTAERRPALADRLAGNAATTGREAISRIAPEHPSALLALTPGTDIQRGSGQEHLTAIRSPVLTGGAGAGSFLFLEDGVPLRAPVFANVNGLMDANLALAENVEVIRGPGGAFYGANAIHGTVNIFSPGADENRQSAYLSASPDIWQASALIARANRGKGYAVGGSVVKDTGWRAESGSERLQMLARHRDETGKWHRDMIVSTSLLQQETAGFITGPEAYRDAALARTNPNPEAYRNAASIRWQTLFSRRDGNAEWQIRPYVRYAEMEFLQHFLPSKAVEQNSHWSAGVQTARYLTMNGGSNLTTGLDMEYTEGNLSEVQTLPDIFSYTQGVHYDYRVAAFSASPFFHFEKPLGDYTLTVAGRADYTAYDYENRIGSGIEGRFLRPEDRRDDFLTFSPKFALSRPAGNGLLFVSYSAGARPPQTTDLYRLQENQTTDDIKPERINAIEAGWRGRVSDRLSGEVVAYTMEKENFLFRDADGFTVSDGKTRHQGLEVSGAARLTGSLSLRGNWSLADHTYRFDRPLSPGTRNPTEAIASGNRIDTAPETLGHVALLWQDGPNEAALSMRHMGAYYTDAANEHRYTGHDIAAFTAARRSGFATFRLNVRNLFDEAFADRADYAFGTDRYFPGQGRTATISLRIDQ